MFYSTRVISSDRNTGVSSNINRAWKAATSEWIKSIAADDVLMPDCVKDNLVAVNNDQDIVCLFSRMEEFSCVNNKKIRLLPSRLNMSLFNLEARDQFEFLLKKSFNIAPTAFLKRDLLAEVDWADERFEMIEDLPLWLKITGSEHRLRFLDKVTVRYRIGDSITTPADVFVNELFLLQKIRIFRVLICPNLGVKDLLFIVDRYVDLYSQLVIKALTSNRKGVLSVMLVKLVRFFRPYWYLSKFMNV